MTLLLLLPLLFSNSSASVTPPYSWNFLPVTTPTGYPVKCGSYIAIPLQGAIAALDPKTGKIAQILTIKNGVAPDKIIQIFCADSSIMILHPSYFTTLSPYSTTITEHPYTLLGYGTICKHCPNPILIPTSTGLIELNPANPQTTIRTHTLPDNNPPVEIVAEDSFVVVRTSQNLFFLSLPLTSSSLWTPIPVPSPPKSIAIAKNKIWLITTSDSLYKGDIFGNWTYIPIRGAIRFLYPLNDHPYDSPPILACDSPACKLYIYRNNSWDTITLTDIPAWALPLTTDTLLLIDTFTTYKLISISTGNLITHGKVNGLPLPAKLMEPLSQTGMLFIHNHPQPLVSIYSHGLISYSTIPQVSSQLKSVLFNTCNTTVILGTRNGHLLTLDTSLQTIQYHQPFNSPVVDMITDQNCSSLWVLLKRTSQQLCKLSLQELNPITCFDLPGVNHTELLIDDNNNIWIRTDTTIIRLMVFNEAKQQVRVFRRNKGEGYIAADYVNDIAWNPAKKHLVVGTNEWLGRITCADPFEPTCDMDHPPLKFNPTRTEFYPYENQIFAILVDPAGNIWFSSDNHILYSTGDLELIKDFSLREAPAGSNPIYHINMLTETGEVFFASDIGISIYGGEASLQPSTCKKVIIYPQPAQPQLHPYIMVKNLPAPSFIQITTPDGEPVYETTTAGSSFIWNMKNLWGQLVPPGIYIGYAIPHNNDQKTCTFKIAVH